MAQMRLQRFLAQAGIAARRKAEVLITEGRVKVNGKKVTTLGIKVDPEEDRVLVDGQPVHQEDLFYAVFNKPKGCITAVSDPEGRRTVLEYLPGLPASVMPVGRLDFYSEGVLLLTNDGALAAALTSSNRQIEKIYHIKIKGSVDDRELKKLREGVRLDGRTVTKPAVVERLKAPSRHDWLEVTLTEGKNRQLHRMLESVGHEITKLQRISFAGLNFHGLRVGDARELTQIELKSVYELSGLKKEKGLTTRGKWAVKRETTDKARRNADRSRERVTPNLTPGGSKVAKAKLLTRYREQEEDGTLPPVPVSRAVAKEKALAASRTAAKKRAASATTRGTGRSKAPARGAARNATTSGRAGKPAARPGKPAARPGKPAARPGKPAARPGKPASRAGKPAARPGAKPASRSARPGAKPTAAPAKRGRPGASAARKNATSRPSRAGKSSPKAAVSARPKRKRS